MIGSAKFDLLTYAIKLNSDVSSTEEAMPTRPVPLADNNMIWKW
jgi:hypothetical protein